RRAWLRVSVRRSRTRSRRAARGRPGRVEQVSCPGWTSGRAVRSNAELERVGCDLSYNVCSAGLADAHGDRNRLVAELFGFLRRQLVQSGERFLGHGLGVEEGGGEPDERAVLVAVETGELDVFRHRDTEAVQLVPHLHRADVVGREDGGVVAGGEFDQVLVGELVDVNLAERRRRRAFGPALLRAAPPVL